MPHPNSASESVQESMVTAVGMVLLAVLAFLLGRRLPFTIKAAKKLRSTSILILIIDFVMAVLVFTTTIIAGTNLHDSLAIPKGAMILWEVSYALVKGLTYIFYTERAFVARPEGQLPHSKTPLRVRLLERLHNVAYRAHCLLIAIPFPIAIVFTMRGLTIMIASNGQPVVGFKLAGLVAMAVFDFGLNVYFCIHFRLCMKKLVAYKDRESPLRKGVRRDCIGTGITSLTTLANLLLLLFLHQQPSWVILVIGLLNIFATPLVLHWVTKNPQKEATSTLLAAKRHAVSPFVTPSSSSDLSKHDSFMEKHAGYAESNNDATPTTV